MTSCNGITMTYDAEGRMTSETFAPGKAVTYAYDVRGQLRQVTDWIGGATAFTHDAAGRLTGMTRPNGTSAANAYDPAGRLSSTIQNFPGPVPLTASSIWITRDALGQVAGILRSAPLVPAVQSPATTNLAYDAASQIAGLSWDPLSRLTSDGSRTFVWDGASRLTHFTAGGENPTFTYDAFGQPLTRTDGAASEQYLWNYAHARPVLEVINPGPPNIRYFIYTPDGLLLESIAGVSGARTFYHYDENGNVMFLSDDTGNVTASYAYSPSGDVTVSGTPPSNPFTFGAAGGILQLGSSGPFLARRSAVIYDPRTSRFISGGATASGGGGISNPFRSINGLKSETEVIEYKDGENGIMHAQRPAGRGAPPLLGFGAMSNPGQTQSNGYDLNGYDVNGIGGDEIFVDKYGRVKVQFFWDRKGKPSGGGPAGPHCDAGAHYPTADLHIRHAGDTGGPPGPQFLPYTFGMTEISKLGWTHDDEGPRESISMQYGAVNWRYKRQTSDGDRTQCTWCVKQ